MQNDNMKLNYRKTMVLGTGFMVISLTWSLFNSFVPIFLGAFIERKLLIGVIMALDNIAGMTVQPFFGAISDRTWTKKGGRRMPYLTVGIPLAAFFILLVPLHISLVTLVVSVILFDVSMSIFRTPTVALMPDLTPAPLRSKANGVINFMGGLGALTAFFLGSQLYKIHQFVPFGLSALLMIGVLFLLRRSIKEPAPDELVDGKEKEDLRTEDGIQTEIVAEPQEEKKDKKRGIISALIHVLRDPDKSCLFLLSAIFFYFIGYNGIDTWFTTYGKGIWGDQGESKAAFLLGFLAISFLINSIPSGFIGTKFGRKKTLIAGLIGLASIMFLLFWFTTPLPIAILFCIGGFSWALININSYPMVVQMAPEGEVGTYTGLYYFFSSTAAVLGPILFGWMMDLLGNSVIFPMATISTLLALFLVSKVKAGEVEEVEEAVRKKA